MDWNNDGKHDWKDDAFYNNVISNETKQKDSSSNSTYKGGASSFLSGPGFVWVVALCAALILIKLFS